jgi:hypothetical protein
MRFLYHLRCQAHHAIRRRTTLEPAIYTHSMVSTRTCISRWEPHDEALLVGHQLQMVIVLERDINYKTILVCLYVSLACRERAGLLFSAWLDGLSFGYDQWPLWFLLGHQLQMVVLERDINYKTILVCLYVSLACRERAGLLFSTWLDGLSLLDMTSVVSDFCSVMNLKNWKPPPWCAHLYLFMLTIKEKSRRDSVLPCLLHCKMTFLFSITIAK